MAPKNKSTKTCYMCDRKAKSKEHIPPKCFFPEKGEIPKAKEYGKNLITVPSCDLHNLDKSNDDQYLLAVIAAHFENQAVSQEHFSAKVVAALKRRPSMFSFYQDNFPITVFGLPSIAFTVDRERFDNAMIKIVRGLYFHEYAEKLNQGVVIHTSDFLAISGPDRGEINKRMQNIDQIVMDVLSSQPMKGENPDIFTYQIMCVEQSSQVFVRLIFYGGFVANAYSSPTVDTKE
jgi:hypothetical protein